MWRWETKGQGPDSADVVERLSVLFGLDLDEVLALAGFRPSPGATTAIPQEYDPELEEILTAPISDAVKEQLVEMVLDERRQDEERRRARTRRLIEAELRRAS